MKNTFKASILSSGISAMFASAAAIAQADVPTANTRDAAVLETVTVTAQKRAQPLQDVPISMTVLDQGALEKSRLRTLYDIQQMAPNFEAVQSPGWSIVSVRGVGGGGRNMGWDTRVGIYLDGVYLGHAQALDQSLNDIEQVEILRGPQGHLFGRNTDAGAISITTRPPGKTFEASVNGGASNYGGREAAASFSGPLSPGVLGKISVSSETRDGYITNLFDGGSLNNLDRSGIRGQLRFQPNQQLQVDLYADYSKIKQNLVQGETTTGLTTGASPVPLAGGPLAHRVVNINTTPFRNSELSGLSLAVNYALAGGNKLTAITGYRDTQQDRANDTDYGPQDLLRVRYADRFKQTSQEIRWASPDARKLRYVVGLYFLREDATTNRKTNIGLDTSPAIYLPQVGANVSFRALGVAPDAVISNDGQITTSTSALFGNIDYDFAPDWTLSLGARYTAENKDVFYNLDGSKSGGFRIATLNGYTDSRSESIATPTAGISYIANKDTNLYVKYSTGFKSGGWNTDFLSTAQVAAGFKFATETVKNYEVGVKGKLFDGRMQYDLAAFNSQFDNYQVFQFVNVGASTALVLNNAAKVDTSGFEASARVRVSRALDIGGSIGILRAIYESFPASAVAGSPSQTGQRLGDTPRFTAAINIVYAVPAPRLNGRFDLSADISYRDSAVLDAPFQDAPIPARTLVNASLRFLPSNSGWSANVWAKNLFNVDYVIARGRDFLGNQFDTRGNPRMFGVTAKYDF